MSQLKQSAILLFLLLAGTTSYIVFAKASQKSSRAEIESPYKWGKSAGPIQVRIEEISKDGNVVTLEGQVSTKLSEVKIEWKLPEGATLVSGQLTETAAREGENSIIYRTVKIKADGQLKKPLVVFSVSSDETGKRRGNTAVYNLNITEAEKEKLENIQQFMKSRGAKPMK